ncbi:hypothetical protein B0H19DRAFT_1062235 [Mycena capillaripes]|nr:hypothetical protein B0H19DRAFT_1062235 [Mycena capillaripes]
MFLGPVQLGCTFGARLLHKPQERFHRQAHFRAGVATRDNCASVSKSVKDAIATPMPNLPPISLSSCTNPVRKRSNLSPVHTWPLSGRCTERRRKNKGVEFKIRDWGSLIIKTDFPDLYSGLSGCVHSLLIRRMICREALFEVKKSRHCPYCLTGRGWV